MKKLLYLLPLFFLFSCKKVENFENFSQPTSLTIYTSEGVKIFQKKMDKPFEIKLSGEVGIILSKEEK